MPNSASDVNKEDKADFVEEDKNLKCQQGGPGPLFLISILSLTRNACLVVTFAKKSLVRGPLVTANLRSAEFSVFSELFLAIVVDDVAECCSTFPNRFR